MITGHINFISGATYRDNTLVPASALVTGIPAVDTFGRPILAAGASITILTDRPSSILIFAANRKGSGGYWVDQVGTGYTLFTAPADLRLISLNVEPSMGFLAKNEYMDALHPIEWRRSAYGHTFNFAIDRCGDSIARPVQDESLLIAKNRLNMASHEIRPGWHFIQDPTYGNTNQRTERIDYNTLYPFDTPLYWFRWWEAPFVPTMDGTNPFAICGQIFGTADSGETHPRGPILRSALFRQTDGRITWSQVTTYDTSATTVADTPLVTRWQVDLVPTVRHYELSRFVLTRNGTGSLKTWLDGAVKFDGNVPLGYNDALGPHRQTGIYAGTGANNHIGIIYSNETITTTDISSWATNPPPIS